MTQKLDYDDVMLAPAAPDTTLIDDDVITNGLTVFVLWCRLTGNNPAEFGDEEREAFLDRPQVQSLMTVPYEVLLDAGITAARRGSLPLERWLGSVRTVRPATVS